MRNIVEFLAVSFFVSYVVAHLNFIDNDTRILCHGHKINVKNLISTRVYFIFLMQYQEKNASSFDNATQKVK